MKIFNFWKKYPDRKPDSSGYYWCSVAKWDGEDREIFIGMVLYYNKSTDKWIDVSRQSVFDGYFVYKTEVKSDWDIGEATDYLCDKTEDVVAWKRVPRVKKVRRK